MRRILFVLFSLIPASLSVNVLVLSPAFGASHTNFMAHLADTLTEAGHNVTFLVPVADESRKNQLGVKITKDVVIVEHDEIMKKETSGGHGDQLDAMWKVDTHAPDFEKEFEWFYRMMEKSCANFIRNTDVFEQMRSRRFDVAILEPLSVCGLGYFKKLGIEKTILASSCSHYDLILPHTGEPEELSYVPSSSSTAGDQMSLYERYQNHKFAKDWSRALADMFDKETAVYQKKWGKEIPDWRELLPAASVFFVNSNPYLDFPRPVLQKTVPIGGITVDFEKIRSQKLDDEWNEILSRREHNMLVSFGSMVKSSQMPIEWKKNLLEVIRSEPNVTFIWKYESDDVSFAEGVHNVFFSKWIPQTALLNDPRLTAFLTHGGLGSTMELAHCGNPAVMVPIFGDQVRNANMLARHGGGIFVWKNDLGDFGIVKRAVHSILYNGEYQRKARHLAEILANQPHQPKDLVVKHTEFLAKFGPFPQMDPHGRRLNVFARNFFDVFALVGLVYVLVASVFLLSARFLLSKISVRFVKKTKKFE